MGRRQLFVRFAGEAETATLYTSAGLAAELGRAMERSRFHSICLTGRDVLGNADYLAAVFGNFQADLPVVLETDGQRPEAVETVAGKVGLIQVFFDFTGAEVTAERCVETLEIAARLEHEHALVLLGGANTSDGQILRVVEMVAARCAGTAIVLHPGTPAEGGAALDRRWSGVLEQMQLLHDDVRVMLRMSASAGAL